MKLCYESAGIKSCYESATETVNFLKFFQFFAKDSWIINIYNLLLEVAV